MGWASLGAERWTPQEWEVVGEVRLSGEGHVMSEEKLTTGAGSGEGFG